jgi:hypothetical protein
MDTFGVEHVMLPLAHAGHWISDVLYVAPLVGLLIWLGITNLKERRAAAAEGRPRRPRRPE